MLWIDYAIIIVIGLSTLISLVRGFVKEAVSLAIWIAAFFIASQFYEDLAVYFTQIDDPLVRNAAAIAALFVATLILGAIINYILSQLVHHTGLSGTDRVLGLVFGASECVLSEGNCRRGMFCSWPKTGRTNGPRRARLAGFFCGNLG